MAVVIKSTQLLISKEINLKLRVFLVSGGLISRARSRLPPPMCWRREASQDDEGREAMYFHYLEVPWIPDKLRGYGYMPVWHISISFFPCWTHFLFGLLLFLLLLDRNAAYYLGRLCPSSFKKYLLTIYYRSGLVLDAGDTGVNQKYPEIDSLCQLCPSPSLSCRVQNEIRTQPRDLPNQKQIKACTGEMLDSSEMWPHKPPLLWEK